MPRCACVCCTVLGATPGSMHGRELLQRAREKSGMDFVRSVSLLLDGCPGPPDDASCAATGGFAAREGDSGTASTQSTGWNEFAKIR